MPGGCDLGGRPIDQHIKGFVSMGAQIEVVNGIIKAQIPQGRLAGGQVYLDFHKPDHGGGSAVKQFILSNLLFIPIALFLYACYRWYETCFLH